MPSYKPLFVPAQSSALRILSGPSSPASPLSPTRTQLHFPVLPSPRSASFGGTTKKPSISTNNKATQAPIEPMTWVWSCHKCHTRYPLGTTRKCLHDGHLFCGGTTVDKYTGKVKRHRACGSEFDYIGWEEFGAWKRGTAGIKPISAASNAKSDKHCENQCDFPSACHWKSRHSPRKDANFDFLDPDCLSSEPDDTTIPTPAPEKAKKTSSSSKKGGSYIDKIVRAAEKRTNQLTTLLSTIEEENNFSSMPGYISSSPPKTVKGAKLPEMSSMNGLSLNFPVMDFSSFPKLRRSASTSTISSHSTSNSETSPPLSPMSTSSTSPTPTLPSNDHQYDNATRDPNASLSDDEELSPISPRRNAWDWTAGDIGIALGSPPLKSVWEDDEDDTIEEDEEGDRELRGSQGN